SRQTATSYTPLLVFHSSARPPPRSTLFPYTTLFRSGAVAGFAYGNNIVHAMTQNDRQLPDTVSSIHGGSQFLHDQYDFDGHGNVLAITDVRPGKAGRRSRTMEYDGLDRLTRVTSPMYGAVGAHYAYNVLDDLVQVNVGGTKGRNYH